MTEEIKQALRSFIIEYADINPEDPEFTDDVHLFDEGFVDSVGAVEIILFLEDNFGIKITQKELTLYPMNTVNEITTVVARKVSEREAG